MRGLVDRIFQGKEGFTDSMIAVLKTRVRLSTQMAHRNNLRFLSRGCSTRLFAETHCIRPPLGSF